MARFQFHEPEDRPDWADRTTQITQVIVRAFGFVLMLVGLWISLEVIDEAWTLYRTPAQIERWAQEIERGSNLDKTLQATRSTTGEAATAEPAARRSSDIAEVDDVLGFRMSYFVAWIIAILLLMLVGRLAIAAVKTGGELALYDLQLRRVSQQVLKQLRQTEPT